MSASAMLFSFTVIPDQGEQFTVDSKTRDLVVWEKTGKGRSLQKLGENLQITDVYAIAFIAARREGKWTGTEEEFQNGVDLAFDIADAEATDPT